MKGFVRTILKQIFLGPSYLFQFKLFLYLCLHKKTWEKIDSKSWSICTLGTQLKISLIWICSVSPLKPGQTWSDPITWNIQLIWSTMHRNYYQSFYAIVRIRQVLWYNDNNIQIYNHKSVSKVEKLLTFYRNKLKRVVFRELGC